MPRARGGGSRHTAATRLRSLKALRTHALCGDATRYELNATVPSSKFIPKTIRELHFIFFVKYENHPMLGIFTRLQRRVLIYQSIFVPTWQYRNKNHVPILIIHTTIRLNVLCLEHMAIIKIHYDARQMIHIII